MKETMIRRNRSVLVVDSNPDVLALVSVILDGPKMRVLRARNITEAVDVLSREYVPVDLVLSSADMLDRIRMVRPNVPVLQMSAVTDSETIRIHGLSSKVGEPDVMDNRGLFRAVVAALEPAGAATRTAAC
jgi:DNA-binding response OmpR family regulator